VKGTLVLAATLALAACATADKPASTHVAAAQSSGTYFCWRERLVTEGDNLVCNWKADARAACEVMDRIPINRKSIVSGPDNAKRCENGQWLVRVTMG
jgi:hypothetical protein